MGWNNKIKQISEVLKKISITNNDGYEFKVDKGLERIKRLLLKIREDRQTVYAIGNGASASMASHFAADLSKNGLLNTQVFFDLSLITAISNDMSYYEVFAEPLKRSGEKGDLLVCISSSGNSPNIIKAVEVAKKMGINVISFSAMDADNKLRSIGDVNVYIPANTYGDAESSHAIILHYCIDQIVGEV